ncbi:hypothetical protein P9112_009548 [Eukaryota sp. TZLM1-RC]
MYQTYRKLFSLSTIHRVLVSSGISHKKCTEVITIANCDLIRHFCRKWNQTIGVVRHEQLIFIDEISFRGEHFLRANGRSPVGSPVAVFKPTVNERQITCAVAIDQHGVVLSQIIEGQFDRTSFVCFLIQ